MRRARESSSISNQSAEPLGKCANSGKPPGKPRKVEENIVTDEKRDAAIVQKFRNGAKQICAKRIWEGVEDEARTTSPTRLGEELKIRREEVYECRKGKISLDMLIAVMCEMGWGYSDLGEMPALRERGFRAYQTAAYWAKTGHEHESEEELITARSLVAMMVLFTHRPYRELKEERTELTEDDWNRFADDLRPEFERAFHISELDSLLPSGEDLKDWMVRWGEWVAECVAAVPHRWLRHIEPKE